MGVYGNMKIADSIQLNDKRFKFKSSVLYMRNDSSVLYHLTYTDKNAAHISLIYQPRHYKVKADYYFVYEQGDWLLNKRINTIVDEKF